MSLFGGLALALGSGSCSAPDRDQSLSTQGEEMQAEVAAEENLLLPGQASRPELRPVAGSGEGSRADASTIAGQQHGGSHAESLHAVEDVFQHRRHTYQEGHPDLEAARVAFGRALRESGACGRARVHLQRAVRNLEKGTDPFDVPLQEARLELAQALFGLGEVSGARSLQNTAVSLLERRLREDHVDLARARLDLGRSQLALGEMGPGFDLIQAAVSVFERLSPATDMELIAARLELSEGLRLKGSAESARAVEERLLRGLEITAPGSALLQRARILMARTEVALGRERAASELLELAVIDLEQSFRGGHPLLVRALEDLAQRRTAEGEKDEAQLLRERAALWAAAVAREAPGAGGTVPRQPASDGRHHR